MFSALAPCPAESSFLIPRHSLPLGTGTVDLRGAVRQLQGIGYDGTITLEVFTPDPHHLAYSRDLLQRVWTEERR